MATTVQDLVNEVKRYVDETDANVLEELNRRYTTMIDDGEAWRGSFVIGSTVAGTPTYALPSFAREVGELTVGGGRFVKGRQTDVADYAQGRVSWSNDADGIWVETSFGAVRAIQLVPTPSVSGLPIVHRGRVVGATDLTGVSTIASLLVDKDLVGALVDGALSTFLARQGEPGWQEFESKFVNTVEKQRRRYRRRFRGAGPAQIRIAQRAP